MWTEIALRVVENAVVCVAIGWPLLKWIAPKWLDHKLAERLEAYKAQRQTELESVKAAYQTELERLRQTLSGVVQRQNLEHQVKFTKLHEQRADVIEELHRRAYAIELDAKSYTSHFGKEQGGDYEKIRTNIYDFREHATQNEIYLSDEVMTAVLNYSEEIWAPVVQTGSYSDYGNADDETRRKYSQKLIDAMEYTNKGLRRKLIEEFRNMLGTLPK